MDETMNEKLKSVLGDNFMEYQKVSQENRAAAVRKLTEEDNLKLKELVKTMNPMECRAVYDNLDVILVETRTVSIREHTSGSVSVSAIWKGVFITAFFENKELALGMLSNSVYLLVGRLKDRMYESEKQYHMNTIGAVLLA